MARLHFRIIVLACLLGALSPCSCVLESDDLKAGITGQGENGILYLETPDGAVYRPFLVKDNLVHIVVANGTDLRALSVRSDYAENIHPSKSDMDFSDFLNPPEVILECSAGEISSYKIILYNLPVMMIDTPGCQEIAGKTERVERCDVRLVGCDGHISNLGTAGIKVRGNSTSVLEKKPYNVRLDCARPVLGMPSSRKWFLIANAYYDRTQLHNATAFEVARLTDYAWVQQGHFVELVLNGEHRGLYYLCEKISIEKERIGISGRDGILLEADVYTGEQSRSLSFTTDYFNKTGYVWKTGVGSVQCSLGWFFREPDSDVPAERVQDILSCMNNMERHVYDEALLYGGGV